MTIDTLRADHVGCYGFALAKTPTIDALATSGARFEQAIAAAPITMPSHSTILTGLYPPAHSVRDNGAYALPDSAVTLAETLKSRGYDTAAFVSAVVLARRYNLDQGFDLYDDNLWSEDKPPMFMIRERKGERTVAEAIKWLSQRRERGDKRPFFAWVHLFEPHQPYKPSRADAALSASLYDAEVAGADRAVAQLLEGVKAERNDTLVVLTADHGESLGEHGEKTHGVFVYDATLRVPLIFNYARGLRANTTVGAPVGTVDVTPTILGALGVKASHKMQGVDLWPTLTAGKTVPDVPLYAESLLSETGFGMAPLYALRFHGKKAIRAPRAELYDLTADPREKKNLRTKARVEYDALNARLETVLKESAAFGIAPVENPMDAETMEALQALGYVAPSGDKKSLGGMDPKDGMALRELVEDARHALQRNKTAKARAALDKVVTALPTNVAAINMLALIDSLEGKKADAVRRYEASLTIDPLQYRVLGQLGHMAVRAGDLDAGQKYLSRAVEIAPRFVEGLVTLGFIALVHEDKEGADAFYAKAIAADPSFPHAWFRYGDLHFLREDWSEALRCYQEALKTLPDHFDLTVQAGLAAQRSGDAALAAEYQRRASEIRPDSWIPTYNLGCLEAVAGKNAAALDLIRLAVEQGLDKPDLLGTDPDLAALRGDPAFAALAAQVKVPAQEN